MTKTQVIQFARAGLHLSTTPRVIPGSKMYGCEADITPKMAADWLERFNKKNRNKKSGAIERYSKDMTSGRWMVTHQGIAFDTNKTITSGQNRLEACVASGVTIRSLVFLNCSPHERKGIDQSAGRTVMDIAKLGHDRDVGTLQIAITRAMCGPYRISPQEVYEFYSQHAKAIDFVAQHLPRRVQGVTSATVLGVVGRAFYYMRRAEIEDILTTLGTGVAPADKYRPIIELREYLYRHPQQNRADRLEVHAKTEAAIAALNNGGEVVVTDEERFPI